MTELKNDRNLRLIKQLTVQDNQSLEWEKIPGKATILASSLHNPNEQLAFLMSINCLSRVDPIITDLDIVIDSNSECIDFPLFNGESIQDSVNHFLAKLNPNVKVSFKDVISNNCDAVLSVGNTNNDVEKINISSDGWIVRLSPHKLTKDFSNNFNPIGAYLAGNFGSLEIFKKILVKKANIIHQKKHQFDFRWNLKFLENEWKFNSFNYTINGNEENPHLPSIIDIGELTIAGIGAGGGACMLSLASFPEIQGIISTIDPDEIKNSNLNRYLYATELDAKEQQPKVTVISKIFEKHTKCTIKSHYEPYGHYSKKLDDNNINLIISTVDNAKTRLDIQWDLPKIILDAAVAGTTFYVNRINFGINSCLGCRFFEHGTAGPLEEELSKIIGLSTEVISQLRADNSIITDEHISIMEKFSKTNCFTLPKRGERFQDWFLYHCGELSINEQSNFQIPVPFAATIPGILLAGEVIKIRCFENLTTRDYFSYDIFTNQMDTITSLNKKPDCPICSNKNSVKRYLEKNNLETPAYILSKNQINGGEN